MTLTARDISFSFGRRAVFRGVTADFPAGEVTAIIGPNGAGKTTLLRILLGVLYPQQGQVLKDGRPLGALSRRERAAAIAYIPQSSRIAFPFTVREVVRMGRYSAGRADDPTVLTRALVQADIADRALDPFGHLSAGQQQRVTVARALAQLAPDPKAKALLADEPVAAMDPSHALHTMALLQQLARGGAAVAVVLHDLSMVLRFASRTVILGADGGIAAQGPTAATLTPEALERVFSVPFRAIPDPEGGRPAALLPVPDRTIAP